MAWGCVVKNTEKSDENADFERGLFVCEKPGIEFAGAGKAGLGIGLIGTQVFSMMFLVPVVGFFVLRNQLGMSSLVSGVFAGVVSVGLVVLGIWFLLKINKGNRKGGGYFKNESDSRFRVRAVVPKKKQETAMMRWVQLAVGGGVGDGEPIGEDELMMVRGGFEPMVVRPWFGVKRDRRYWWTFVVMMIVVAASAVYGLSIVLGGWGALLNSVGFMGYALTGLAMVGGAMCAELIWPVYVRLVPGQLYIFRYGFLGSGEPTVDSFDLHTIGLCVDFGGYIVSLEPARLFGEPLPAMVMGKRWPNAQSFPDDYQPSYFTVAMMRGRRAFAQRLVQAARTDEPTPPVSMDRLGE